MVYRTRTATPADAASIARIYNQGIEDRLATFETRLREPGDVEGWVTAGLPVVVVEDEAGEVVAWASAGPYRLEREVYAGIGDFSVYVARERRGEGAGRAALRALIEETASRGYWKLVGRIFPENGPSLALARSLGFREVGVYRRHARLDGDWRDCVVVERLLDEPV